MRCLHLQFRFLPVCSKQELKQHVKKTRFPSLNCYGRESSMHTISLRTKALPSSIVLAASASPMSTDLSSFLRVSAGLFFVFWIGNFVVPDLISKFYEFDKVNEDQKISDVNAADDSPAEEE